MSKQGLLSVRIAEYSVLFYLLFPLPATAQIVPDATLPTNSIVKTQENTNLIEGGTRGGSNLFHSFDVFSLPTGSTAYFNNSPDIQNIFSRVTGLSGSNIDGLIRANGTANFLLINPNGIIFGPNASLNIGGSFLASTASSLDFADGNQFSAKSPQITPLLIVSTPVGLRLDSNPGEIQIQGAGNSVAPLRTTFSPITRASTSTGLQVQPGKTLALVGGNVSLIGGTLTAEKGRVEIGSVDSSSVQLSPSVEGWILGYTGVSAFKDIQLSQRALIDVSGTGSGSIQVQGSHVKLTGGSVMLIQNQGLQPSGALSINAPESLEVNGASTDGGIPTTIRTQPISAGDGGDIVIRTRRLVVQDGAGINSVTYGAGKGGNVTVNASDSVDSLGFSFLRPNFNSNIAAFTFNSGNAGNVSILTGDLTVTNGGAVVSSTLKTGAGGNVTISANNSVKLIGENKAVFAPSLIGASAFNTGNAGQVRVDTSKVVIADGGAINSSTLSSGSAGSVTINASDSVELSGQAPNFANAGTVSSSAYIANEVVQRLFNLPLKPSGRSGNVRINTRKLNISNGGLVSVKNDGDGDAGDLTINADSVHLDNYAKINASTYNGQGGNIKINSRDLLLMRRNSQISTSAGNEQAGGDGGQININTRFLVAPPLENSDITANAFSGKGGSVNVSATAIFGLVPRSREELQTLLRTDNPIELDPARLPSSDITAISQTNPSLSGDLTIITPNVNPTNGLVELPTAITDLSNSIGQGCAGTVGPGASKFIISGRGGLPEDPTKPLNGQTIWTDSRLFLTTEKPTSPPAPTKQPTDSTAIPLTEASLVEINLKGEAVLTAAAPSSSLQVPWLTPPCHAS